MKKNYIIIFFIVISVFYGFTVENTNQPKQTKPRLRLFGEAAFFPLMYGSMQNQRVGLAFIEKEFISAQINKFCIGMEISAEIFSYKAYDEKWINRILTPVDYSDKHIYDVIIYRLLLTEGYTINKWVEIQWGIGYVFSAFSNKYIWSSIYFNLIESNMFYNSGIALSLYTIVKINKILQLRMINETDISVEPNKFTTRFYGGGKIRYSS